MAPTESAVHSSILNFDAKRKLFASFLTLEPNLCVEKTSYPPGSANYGMILSLDEESVEKTL
jgi:hypothetical protein